MELSIDFRITNTEKNRKEGLKEPEKYRNLAQSNYDIALYVRASQKC